MLHRRVRVIFRGQGLVSEGEDCNFVEFKYQWAHGPFLSFYDMKKLLILLLAAFSWNAYSRDLPVKMGELFPDTDRCHINAHGGNIVRVDSVYYWYGECRGDGTPGSYHRGVSCYSSVNLRDWENQGVALEVVDDTLSCIRRGCIIERPKVVYCPATGKYVMWFHNELYGRGYEAAYAGVATSDSPTGPFVLKHSGRVNQGIAPLNLPVENVNMLWPDDLEWWTPHWREAVADGLFTVRDLPAGQMARDMTIFVDPDTGKAYHIYSAEENLTLNIAELDETYENHTGKYIRIFPGGHNEAPAIFKRDGKYWMITSGCTGWAPNAARLMCADDIMGEWTLYANPCIGEGSDKTFGGQGSYIFPLDGEYYFMADIWNPKNLADSRYIWLPIRFDDNGFPYIPFPDDFARERTSVTN